MNELNDDLLDDDSDDEVYPDVIDLDDDVELEIIPELPKIEISHRSWEIYLDNELFDTVLYPSNLNARQVRCMLIVQDDYPIDITVKEI